jgi:hypothetical protein
MRESKTAMALRGMVDFQSQSNKIAWAMKDSDAFSTRLRTPTPSEMKGGKDAD